MGIQKAKEERKEEKKEGEESTSRHCEERKRRSN